MEIVRMNTKITFFKNEITIDEIGNHFTIKTPFYSCFAALSNKSNYKAETQEIGQIINKPVLSFVVRYCEQTKKINESFFIHWGDDFYNILQVNYFKLNKKNLEFLCQKVVNNE